ncbi:MAG: NUDIX hydrolase, partial [Stackebrandtia sp.]
PVVMNRYGVGVENQHRRFDGPLTGTEHDATDSGPPASEFVPSRHHRQESTSESVMAAGGVLWRSGPSGEIEVAGVYRPKRDNWSLPKGKLEADEHRLIGACREVQEETGLTPVPQTFLTRAKYRLKRHGGDITKVVDFWSMRARHPRAEFVPNDEVTRHRWLNLDEAAATLTRPRDQQALQAFRRLPTVTSTILLIRHAQAEPIGADGTDSARRLDSTGQTRAAELAPLLAVYDPQQNIAATVPRCMATMAPLAAAMGVMVAGESLFEAEAHEHNAERATQRLRELADTHTTVAVCSQAPVIADSLAILADTDGIELASVHTSVGGVWVLSFTHKTLVSIERL